MKKQIAAQTNLNVAQLRRATELAESIETKSAELEAMRGDLSNLLQGDDNSPRERQARKNRAEDEEGENRTAGGRERNAMTLKQAIIKVLGRRTMSLDDILKGVLDLGYKFNSVRPQNSVGAYLYSPNGKKVFNNKSGQFSVNPKAIGK